MNRYLNPPKKCHCCDTPFPRKAGTVMYNAKTKWGLWGNLCQTCFMFGPGLGKLGVGFGQKYVCNSNGFFLKEEG